MTPSPTLAPAMSAPSKRLSRLARLDDAELDALREMERDRRRFPARRELSVEGEPIRHGRALLSGWACRQRILADGRRQILGFLLPGDLIEQCRQAAAMASTTILAITEVTTCPVPAAQPGTGLAEAFARSAGLDQRHLMAQVTRLGRMSSYERLADWLLETLERLTLVDLATADEFALPCTQEMLGDALGLTSVHVNRMLQALRRDGLLHWHGGRASLPDRAKLAKLVDYRAPQMDLDDWPGARPGGVPR